MAPPAFTGNWQELTPAERRLTGVRALELADPAEEAQAIALALREALEDAGPDRRSGDAGPQPRPARLRASQALGDRGRRQRRPAARRRRRPAPCCSPLASAAAERFAPVPLLALLKHPLVMAGRGPARLARRRARARPRRCAGRARRRGWTGSARISPTGDERDARAARERAPPGGAASAPLLRPLERGRSEPATGLAGLLAALREAASRAGRRRSLGAARRAAPPPSCSPIWRRRRRRGRSGSTPASCRPCSSGCSPPSRGAPALRPASAPVHLGPDRGAAAACRSDGPRRAQRRRLAGLAGARSLAGAAAARRARPAVARAPDRPCRP